MLATNFPAKFRWPQSLQRLDAFGGEEETSHLESGPSWGTGENPIWERGCKFRESNNFACETTATFSFMGLLRIPTLLQSISWLWSTRAMSRKCESWKRETFVHVSNGNLPVNLHNIESIGQRADEICARKDDRGCANVKDEWECKRNDTALH